MFTYFFIGVGFIGIFVANPFVVWVLLEVMVMFAVQGMVTKTPSYNLLFIFYATEVVLSLGFLVGITLNIQSFVLVFLIGKMGMFPFWFWVVRLFMDVELKFCCAIMTFYKVLVIIILWSSSINLYMLVGVVSINFMSGVVLLVVTESMSMFLCFCVIFSTGWMLVGAMNLPMLVVFFSFYVGMVYALCGSQKGGSGFSVLLLSSLFLFYVGFPPFPSFYVKLILIMTVLQHSYVLGGVVMISLVVFFSLLWRMMVGGVNKLFVGMFILVFVGVVLM